VRRERMNEEESELELILTDEEKGAAGFSFFWTKVEYDSEQ